MDTPSKPADPTQAILDLARVVGLPYVLTAGATDPGTYEIHLTSGMRYAFSEFELSDQAVGWVALKHGHVLSADTEPSLHFTQLIGAAVAVRIDSICAFVQHNR